MILSDEPHDGYDLPLLLESGARSPRSKAHAIARILEARGATRVVLACERIGSFIPALFGAWQARVRVELPPNVQAGTLASLYADPTISSILHDRDGEGGIFVPGVRPEPGDDRPLRSLAAGEPLVTLHTSGTTSAPKRVDKTARELLGEVSALAATFGPLPGAFLCTVPTFHIYGLLFGVLLPLRLGRRIVDERPLFPGDVAAALAPEDIGVLVSTPAHLRAFLGTSMPKRKTAFSSGARLDPATHFELGRELGWTVHDVLGSTETGGIATRSSPFDGWRPLSGVRVTADLGRLTVESPWAGSVRTEDAVELDGSGTFHHLGRMDDVIKVAGRRITRAALETLLREFGGVHDAVVHSEEDDARGTRLFAAVTPATVDTGALRDKLMRELDPILVPRRILAVDQLPRDGMGKLARGHLQKLFGIPETEPETATFSFEPTSDPNAFRVIVPKRSLYFRGHFDVFPILPAVVQLARIIAPLVRQLHPDLGAASRLRRGRFRRPLTPGTELLVKLARVEDRIDVEILVLGQVAASAMLEFLPRTANRHGMHAMAGRPT